MRVAGVDEGTLRRVIAVGSSVDAAGARVGHFVEVTVSDDAGTAYVASGQGGGSSPGASRHEIRFAPAPPEDAHGLIFHVASFADPFHGRAVQLEGPWEFRVEL
jgi:hypothetical protein